MNKLVISSIFLLLFFARVHAQVPTTVEGRIKAVENSLAPDIVFGDSVPSLNIIDQLAKHNIKGISIAVISNHQIDWAKGYGWATVESDKVTANTRFQAASISKSLNSLALLKLVQQGKINLLADINTYLKTWKFPYDSLSGGKKISLANLLSHTAGLSVHGFAGYETTDTLPTLVQILDGKKPANSPAIRSQFPPGQKFQYSGGGTTISQLILTDVTGRKYEEYMRKEVLDPIGMKNSFFTQPPPAGTKDLATAYHGDNPVKGRYHIYPEQAAAGLWTTPTDLAKYILDVISTSEGKSAKVLNKEMMTKRLTPYVDSNAALGLFIVKKGDDMYFTHNGGNEGFLCTSFGGLKNGNGIVVMINGDDFQIINEVMNSVFRVYGWSGYKPIFKKVYKVPKDTLSQYVGNYLLKSDTINIRFRGEELVISQNGDPAEGLPVVFNNSTDFSIPAIPSAVIKMVFTDGKVTGFGLEQGGGKFVAKRIED